MATSPSMIPFAALLAIGVYTLIGCSSAQLRDVAPPAEGGQPKVSESYAETIKRFSDGQSEYNGFYNSFEYRATLLNTVIRSALLSKQAEHYLWDSEKLAKERERSLQEMSSQTDVFLSFYTPVRTNDNLTGSKSIWKVYLEVGGRRYQGTPKKVRTLLAELQALYPYHTRWNTPYTVTFPVPTTAIENQASVLTITGPLGTRTVTFPAVY